MPAKKFQHTSNTLATVWGHTGASGTGSASQHNAARAGVKREAPLTPDELAAQQLVAELQQVDLATSKSTDSRTAFEKRYDIHDGMAHVTPDLFYQMLGRPNILVELRKIDIHHVHIGDAHIDLTFTMVSDKQNPPADCMSEKIITTRDLRVRGLAATLGGASKACVKGNLGVMGYITTHHLSPALISHASQSPQQDSFYMAGDTGNQENFTRIFRSVASLEDCLQRVRGTEGLEIRGNFYMDGSLVRSMPLGKLRHIADIEASTITDAPTTNVRKIRLLARSFSATTQDDLLNVLYWNNNQLLICKGDYQQERLAVLYRLPPTPL